MNRTRRCSHLVLCLAGGLALIAVAPGLSQVLILEPAASGLVSPTVITHAGDGSSRLFVVERAGTIRIVDAGTVLPTPYLDIDARVGSGGGEQGLLGLAFDPDYESNGFFYVNYIDNAGDTVISRFSVRPNNPDRADPNSEVVLKTIAQPGSNHNGGDMHFGPDLMLYVATGDGDFGGDPGDVAQDLGSLLGKILRLDVDNPPDYIPADNPFVGVGGALDEIWSYGLRNPWRTSFDRDTGDFFIADVGEFSWEEIDFQPASSSGGENWGWDVLEGEHCHENVPAGSCNDYLNGGSDLPILEYPHGSGDCSVTGGYRYRGSQFADLDGLYIYGDFCTGRIWAGSEDAPGVWSSSLLLDTSLNISNFGEDEAGELYVADISAGDIYRLTTEGGGGIPCEDLDRFQARCVAGPRLQARVRLTDTSHDGETITFTVDGEETVVPISGSTASLQTTDVTSGNHTVGVVNPPGCFEDRAVVCP